MKQDSPLPANQENDAMASRLVAVMLATLDSFCEGDLAARMPSGFDAQSSQLAGAVNHWLAMAGGTLREIRRLAAAIGAGKLQNRMPQEINGHPLRGPFLELANELNGMCAQLAVTADEMQRIAHEIGVEGRLGGRVQLHHARGAWGEMRDSMDRLSATLSSQLGAVREVATSMARGDPGSELESEAHGEFALLKDSLNAMIRTLQNTHERNAEQDWLKTNLTAFTRRLQGKRNLVDAAELAMSELASLLGIQHGVFYAMDDSLPGLPCLRLVSSYAGGREIAAAWRLGEGLIGQCAKDRKPLLVANAPADYIAIRSGTGAATPTQLLLLPILYENQVKAVMELAGFSPFSAVQLSFLEQLCESIGIVMHAIEASTRTENLLAQSQSLAQELQSQQEMLRSSNEALLEKAVLLQRQKTEMEHKNREVELTKLSLEDKAEQLMLASRYKSEFLSSMSHELRTPLSSLLLLAEQLAVNHDGNLSPRQVEYAGAIQDAGHDLLKLINETLDLAKIESGTVTLELGELHFPTLAEQMRRMFKPIAANRGLEFLIRLSPELPGVFRTDGKRLLQVLRNLLSNAFKFTDSGCVTLEIEPVHAGWSPGHALLEHAPGGAIAFIVRDTGAGVPREQQKLIFEAFQQGDTGSSRRYGGTGLGLSISRGLATLMRGELRLLGSEPGHGSSFALYLPGEATSPVPGQATSPVPDQATSPSHEDAGTGQRQPRPSTQAPPLPAAVDRDEALAGERPFLLLTQNLPLAQELLSALRQAGENGIIAGRSATGIEMAERFHPEAILLDMDLPDADGWQVLERLKRHAALRHIPVLPLCEARECLRAMRAGAFHCLPASADLPRILEAMRTALAFSRRRQRRLLLVAEDEEQRSRLAQELGHDDLEISACSPASARQALEQAHDCLLLHLPQGEFAGAFGFQQDRQQSPNAQTPLVLHLPEEPALAGRRQLGSLAAGTVLRRVHSMDRLLDDTALFLHRDLSGLDEPRRRRIERLYRGCIGLEGCQVLIVDDDIRNLFALTGLLEQHRMDVRSVETGRDALDLLQRDPGIAIVLMDIMMPDMDGYDTMRSLRQDERFLDLPIIALTAKAMKGDLEKCLAAGASDYVSKPVDSERLLALMRGWLYR